MTEPTLTQIAKKCRDSWRAWAQVDDENEDGDGLPDDMTREWVEHHIRLCDAVIESEIRREEFEWLREFEKRVHEASDRQDFVELANEVDAAFEWLDKQRSDREGPQT